MTESNSTRTPDTSLTRDLLDIVRYHLRSRRGLIVLASVTIVAGLAFNWSWLVAVGIAPLLLAGLPCIAMCALGLCMRGMGGRSCSTNTDVSRATDTATERGVNAAGDNSAKPAQEKEHENA